MNASSPAGSNGQTPIAGTWFFKARDGRWLSFETPTSQIPSAPAPAQRLEFLLLQASAIHREIAAIAKTLRRGRA